MIDLVRCPLAYEEFTLKEYMRERDGSWIDEIPDGNDHCIDAVRCAVMDDVLRGDGRGFLNIRLQRSLLGVGCRGLLDLLNNVLRKIGNGGAYAAVGMGCSAAFLHLQMLNDHRRLT